LKQVYRESTFEHKIEARLRNHCCSGKAMCYIFWICVCRLRYPACNVHAPYCHLWPVQYLLISTIIYLQWNIFKYLVILQVEVSTYSLDTA